MPRQGVVYTFYSYKGGVGRTMALANVAALLSKWGQKVLIVDWDLEAPGLEKYFSDLSNPSEPPRRSGGVIDLVYSGIRNGDLDWRDCLLKVYPFDENNPISIITAGADRPNYRSRLQCVNWEDLFDKFNFGSYLEQLRKEWISEFDFILIDSRTGITDIGGICTIYLPDVLVLLFTANSQSLDGVIDVITSAKKKHKSLPFDRPQLLGLPVPSKFENATELKLAQEWKAIFARELATLYKEWIPKTAAPNEVVDKLFLPYVPYWSFGEGLPVVHEGATDPRSLGFAYEFLAKLILHRLQWAEALEGDIAMSRERAPAVIDREAEEIFAALSPSDQKLARTALTRLVWLAPAGKGENGLRKVSLQEFNEGAMRVIRALVDAQLLVVEPGDSAENETVAVADEALLRHWGRLKEWLKADRGFLLWRQNIDLKTSEWKDADQDKSVLLSGMALKRATKYLADYKEGLNSIETTYIRHSIRERTKKRVLIVICVALAVLIVGGMAFYIWKTSEESAQKTLESQRRTELESRIRANIDEIHRFTSNENMPASRVQFLLDEMKDLVVVLGRSAGYEQKLTESLVFMVRDDCDFAKLRHVEFANMVAGRWEDYSSYLANETEKLEFILFKYSDALQSLRAQNPGYFETMTLSSDRTSYETSPIYTRRERDAKLYDHFLHIKDGFTEHLNIFKKVNMSSEIEKRRENSLRRFQAALCNREISTDILSTYFDDEPCTGR